MNETIEPMGAWMRKQTEANGTCTREIGTLFLHLTRHGNEWALELCDEKPISIEVAQHWANEVGAPVGADEHATTCAAGRVWRYEWQGTEEPAAAGSQAFYLGGAK